MSYTLATAVDAVRNNLNEQTAVFWEDTELETWIKEGTLIFSSATLMVEADDTIALATNQLSYTSSDESFIASVLEPYSVYYDDGNNNYKGLIKGHPRMLGHLDTFTSGEPKYYMFHNRTFYIWPLPSSDENTKTIMVLYSKKTNDITDLEDEFQIWPIIYATAKAKEKDRREAEAGSMLAQFYTMINFERQDKHAREVDSEDKFLIPVGGQDPEASRG